MDKELEVLQWLSLFSVKPTNYYANRCFPDMAGSSLQWGSNMKAMVRWGQSLANKCGGLLARKLAPFFSPKGKKWKPYTLSKVKRQPCLTFWQWWQQITDMLQSSTKIWHYLPNHNTSIAAEYLPSVLNTVADMNIGKTADSSE